MTKIELEQERIGQDEQLFPNNPDSLRINLRNLNKTKRHIELVLLPNAKALIWKLKALDSRVWQLNHRVKKRHLTMNTLERIRNQA